ncbi:MAG: hypothetical protein H0W72_11350 [Planctomycetes bacterium]|nr:hypothetical protein [Planctomycetota bacterium]
MRNSSRSSWTQRHSDRQLTKDELDVWHIEFRNGSPLINSAKSIFQVRQVPFGHVDIGAFRGTLAPAYEYSGSRIDLLPRLVAQFVPPSIIAAADEDLLGGQFPQSDQRRMKRPNASDRDAKFVSLSLVDQSIHCEACVTDQMTDHHTAPTPIDT